jgi:NAD(P)-dependent dehydrogenase (short-subunit alcohol dehydrogenase family)
MPALAGKVAAITGATSGIGAVVSRWQPLQSVARAADIAQAALFLASDASRMITGHNLVVDGGISAGWSIAGARADRALFFNTMKQTVAQAARSK